MDASLANSKITVRFISLRERFVILKLLPYATVVLERRPRRRVPDS